MSFSVLDVDRRTRKGNFLQQIDYLIDWQPIEAEIKKHYIRREVDAVGRTPYPGILLFKMLLVGIWYGGLSDVAVEDIANSNLYVMRFLGLELEDNVPDHTRLSVFRSALSKNNAWDTLLQEVNRQVNQQHLAVKQGYHVDASVTPSNFKPKNSKPIYEVTKDRDETSDESQASEAMQIEKKSQSGIDEEARYTYKSGKYHFGYKQHTMVDNNGLVQAVITTAANTHDSIPFVPLVEKANLPKGVRINTDKAYASSKHTYYLKAKGFKNGIQKKAAKGKPLSARDKQRNSLIGRSRFVVERTFGGQALWFGGKNLRYKGTLKAHGWHVLQGLAYNLKRLPLLFVNSLSTPLQGNLVRVLGN